MADVIGRLVRIEATVDDLKTQSIRTAGDIADVKGRLDREVLRRVELSEAHHEMQDKRIDSLEAWRDEAQGGINLVKFAVGGSLLAAIVTTITLIAFLSGGPHP